MYLSLSNLIIYDLLFFVCDFDEFLIKNKNYKKGLTTSKVCA